MTDTFDPLAAGPGDGGGDEYGVDFNGVGDWGGDFAPYPAGPYVYTVTAASPERSKANNPMIELALSLNPDHHPSLAGHAPERYFLVLTAKALPKVKVDFAAIMRLPQEVVNTMRLGPGWWNDLLGKDVIGIATQQAYTKTDEMTGEKKSYINMNIDGFLPFTGDPPIMSVKHPNYQPSAQNTAPETPAAAPAGGFTV